MMFSLETVSGSYCFGNFPPFLCLFPTAPGTSTNRLIAKHSMMLSLETVSDWDCYGNGLLFCAPHPTNPPLPTTHAAPSPSLLFCGSCRIFVIKFGVWFDYQTLHIPNRHVLPAGAFPFLELLPAAFCFIFKP